MPIGPVRRDDATAAFFDAAADGALLLLRCPEGHWSQPDVRACETCGRTELTGAPAAGDATLVSWTVTYGRAAEGEQPPRSVLAIGQLAEGPWWWAQLLDADPATLRAGQALTVVTERGEGDDVEAVPAFRVRS